MLNLTNLFATRENFRQHTIEHAQLERVLAADGIDNQLQLQSAGKIDGSKINYIGQSLGGILGPVYTAASPRIRNAVFNVPAGNLSGILLTSPAFATARTGFLNALAAQGINQGTPAFDQFIGLSKMILDPADPINYVYAVENGPASTTREALIQYIQDDEVAPNPLTEALIAAANNRAQDKKDVATKLYNPSAAQLPGPARHGFLLNRAGDGSTTTQGQMDAVQFINTGTLP
jgi:pimeloyl-ACP methyl ester carboxylesterase